MTRLVVAALILAAPAAAGPEAHQVKLNGHTFTLPKGFTIELAAKTPLVDRPIVASFDDRGRLYVADSSGSNEKPDVQLKNPTHRIVRLEDTTGKGVFDEATVFADKMMFPEGILWHRGSVLVGAPPGGVSGGGISGASDLDPPNTVGGCDFAPGAGSGGCAGATIGR